MRAYQTSTSTLSAILQNPSLSLDTITKTTDDLAQVLADSDEVSQAVRLGGEIAVQSSGSAVDEDELELELEDLIREEKESEAKKENDKAEIGKESRPMSTKSPVVFESINASSVSTNSRSPNPDRAAETIPTDHEAIYEAAQQREKEEKERAEIERIKRDKKLLAAE